MEEDVRLICVELVDGCNLKCALCWNRNRVGTMKQMSLETAQFILNKYQGQRIDWYNWGEPLFHKDFLKICEMVAGSVSTISTNFSMGVSDDYLRAMQNFSIIYVSMSGMTPEVYNIYHRGGDFGLVIGNLIRLALFKRTRIVVRFGDHKYNKPQQELFKKFCCQIGVEPEVFGLNCEVEELVEGFDHELLRVPKFRCKSEKFKCIPFYRETIDVEGNQLLCCTSHNVILGKTVFDNISGHEIRKIKLKIPLCMICRENGYWRMF